MANTRRIIHLRELAHLEQSNLRFKHLRLSRSRHGFTLVELLVVIAIIGILIAWQLFSHVFDPVFLFTLNLLYPGAGYQ